MRSIYKLLSALPAVLYDLLVIAVCILSSVRSLEAVAWLYAALLTGAAVLLIRNKWWGSLPGILAGMIVIWNFVNSRVHHHINETPIGIALMVYFMLLGLGCRFLYKKNPA